MAPELHARILPATLALLALAATALGYHEVASKLAPPCEPCEPCECADELASETDGGTE